MSTQVPPQLVGVADGQTEAHEYEVPAPTHAGVLPVQALPQAPQLSAVVSWTQAPLQAAYPVSQANVHALLTQTAWALATLVEHPLPQAPQLVASLVASMQPPLQLVGVADGHPDAHEYAPPEPAHTGAAPEHACPQLPQLAAVVFCTQAPPQRLYPALHENEQVPAVHMGWELARLVVQALPQLPQLAGLVRSTQAPSHSTWGLRHEARASPWPPLSVAASPMVMPSQLPAQPPSGTVTGVASNEPSPAVPSLSAPPSFPRVKS